MPKLSKGFKSDSKSHGKSYNADVMVSNEYLQNLFIQILIDKVIIIINGD